MVAPLQRPGARPVDRRGAAREPERAHRRPSHHGSARPARDRRQHALPAGPAGHRRGALGAASNGQADAIPTRCPLSAGFQVGWELDFWGKFRRSIEAADAGYFASIAQYDDLQVLMAAQVASLYCSIRTVEARLVIARENAALQKRSLDIAERLFKGGDESELDVQQAKAQYLATLAAIPALEGVLRQTQNALGALLARPPGPLPEMARGQGRDPAGRAGRHRRHAGRPAAPPSGHPRRGAADGRPVGADRRERGRSLSVDLAVGLVGLSATSLGSTLAGVQLGPRPHPGLERVRPGPPHQRRPGPGRALPATPRAVPGRGAARGARGRRRRGRLREDRASRSCCSRTR